MMSESENWNDEYQDDIESQGMPLIRQGQSNSPKVLEGVFGIGDFLMPNGLVAKGYYQFLAIGCDDLHVHWAANRGGLLGFLPGSETPKDTAWLKPGPAREGFPSVTKEGRYAPDGSVREHTIYLHCMVVAVGRPAIRLDQPICGTFALKGRNCRIGQDFYRSKLKAVKAVIDGKVVCNMTLGLFEMSSENARDRSYSWMAPKLTSVGVVGEPSGPSLEMSRVAMTIRHNFKQGRAWASGPLPAIATPPTEAPRIASAEPERHAASAKPKIDIRSGLEAWRGPADPSSPPIPPDNHDGDVGGPRSLDEVIFD
jgi:hypothetical protein